jgi:hypothetical protein
MRDTCSPQADPMPADVARRPRGARGRAAAGRLALVALLPLLIALIWWARGRAADDPVRAAMVHSAAAANAVAPRGTQTKTSQDAGVATPAARSAAAQSSLRRRFETSDDLYAFARDLAPALRRGDPEALWLMSKVADYCAGYSVDPAGYASDTRLLADMDLANAAALTAARERVGRRCGRFTVSDGLSRSMVRQLREQAAGAGSLAAEAALMSMGHPLQEGEGYASDLVARVRDSLDPDAYNALSPASAGGGSLFALSDAPAPPQFNQLAWQIAACKLGLDCGPDGALMTNYCVNGGICSEDPAQGFEVFVFDAAVPRQSEDVLRGMVQTLIGRDGGNT